MQENLKSHKAQVCDSRGPDLFNHSPNGRILYHTVYQIFVHEEILVSVSCLYTHILTVVRDNNRL